MLKNNKKPQAIEETFEEKAKKQALKNKRLTQVLCFVLAALMVLGGGTGIIVALLSL